MSTLSTIVDHALSQKASDIKLIVGERPHIRVNGELLSVEEQPALSKETMTTMVNALLKVRSKENVNNSKPMRFTVKTQKCRLRISIGKMRSNYGLHIRILPARPLSIEEGHFPSALRDLIQLDSGLIIVCGKKGAGISTAVKSMLDARIGGSVLAIEDSIEIPFRPENSMIIQQEVGTDGNKTELLRDGNNQRHDVIALSFEANKELIEVCLETAASSLVVMEMTALNQLDAMRRLELAMNDSRSAATKRVAMLCRSIIHIQPIKLKSGERKPLVGIININETCRDIISEGLYEELEPMCRQEKCGHGSQNIDNMLSKWVREGLIDMSEALRRAWNPSAMELRAKGIIHTE